MFGRLFNVGHLKSTADVMLDFRRDPSLLTTFLPGRSQSVECAGPVAHGGHD